MGNREQNRQDEAGLALIRKLIQDIRYGSISIYVQDGKIVQIEKTEKYRINN